MFYSTSADGYTEDVRILLFGGLQPPLPQSMKTQFMLPEPSAQAVGGTTQSILDRPHSNDTLL